MAPEAVAQGSASGRKQTLDADHIEMPPNKAMPRTRLRDGSFAWRPVCAAELGRYVGKWILRDVGPEVKCKCPL